MIVDKDKIDEVSGVVKSVQGMELVTSGKVCAVKSDQKWEIK